MTTIEIRKALYEDKEKLVIVEAKSTPNLRYVPHVFNQFLEDKRGEFCVAEIDGEMVGCAKFTITPNGSAWVETLRVIPERQGLGVGKRLYQRFFEIAEREEVSTMRMYTGINNAVSKGLAEQAGFQLEATFCGMSLQCDPSSAVISPPAFHPITDPRQATALIMEHSLDWNDFLVMNRTFYKLTPELCAYLVQLGQVYQEPISGSVVVLGARFMPEQALHLGLFAGDHDVCLQFARAKAAEIGVKQLSCLFPASALVTKQALGAHGFEPNAAEFIVMRGDV
ncbi:MAG: N-acetylglutamate synthase-like GNAT family acetyltransferase [Cellvibrionaceae bacterium]|jgi:N-acetylglutamate synthase-like GNAT family acetyltransferase